MKKKFLSFMLAICLLIPAIFALTACGNPGTNKTMNISVNPEVSFVVDGNNKVINVILENEDAGTIYANVNFAGMTAENAVKILIERSVISGHFTLSGDTVSLEVNGSNEQDIAKLKEIAKDAITNVCDSLGVEIQVQAETLTAEARKAALIASAKILAPEKSQEELEEMSADQLVTLIKNKQEQLKGLAYSQVEDIKEAFSAATNTILNSINDLRNQIEDMEAEIEAKLEELANASPLLEPTINAFIETKKQAISSINTQINQLLSNYETAKAQAINTAKQQYETIKASLVDAYNQQVQATKTALIAHLDSKLASEDITQEQYNYWKNLID